MHADAIIYHAGCPDGFCAAYVAQMRFPEARLLPMTHGTPLDLQQFKDVHVLVVDFSWKRGICEQLAETAASLLILDHHKTAEQELKDFDFAKFDMNRSGATLTWDTLMGGPRPWYVNYVEDRDLARYALPDSKAVSAYIMSLPHTVEAWSRLTALSLDYVKSLGTAIRVHIDRYVQEVMQERRIGMLAGHRVAIVNAPFQNIGDICMSMLQYAPIGCGWFERGDAQVQFSLRATGDIDVSQIAEFYGGGGHKSAAGFQLPYRQGYAVVHQILGRLTDFDRSALHLDKILNRERMITPGVLALMEYPHT